MLLRFSIARRIKYLLQAVISKILHYLNLSWLWSQLVILLALSSTTELISFLFSELAMSLPTFGLTLSFIWKFVLQILVSLAHFHPSGINSNITTVEKAFWPLLSFLMNVAIHRLPLNSLSQHFGYFPYGGNYNMQLYCLT